MSRVEQEPPVTDYRAECSKHGYGCDFKIVLALAGVDPEERRKLVQDARKHVRQTGHEVEYSRTVMSRFYLDDDDADL